MTLTPTGPQPPPHEVDPAPLTGLTNLLEQVRCQKATAFTELYQQLAPRVFGLILRVTGNPARAEEVLQEVFLEVWAKADTYDRARGTATTWVLTIAHRRAVDAVRAHAAASGRDHKIGIRDLPTDIDTVSESADQREDANRVRAALASLTDRQRLFLHLAYYDGHSQTTIAALTNTPLGTVKSTTRSALTRLRTALTATA